MDDQIAMVADGLNTIDMESSPSDVENFNRAVQKLCQKPNTDPAVTVSIVTVFGSPNHTMIVFVD